MTAKNPSRRDIRLKNYDYSRNGAYFITICTKNKQCLFWENYDLFNNVGAATGRPREKIHLSEYGKYVRYALNEINHHYPMVFVDKYVIMPNHIHVIIRIDSWCDDKTGGRPMAAPTISQIINQFKGYVSKKSGFHVWQKLFYDHIIRNEKEYAAYWQYIENNPINWVNDEYYKKEK